MALARAVAADLSALLVSDGEQPEQLMPALVQLILHAPAVAAARDDANAGKRRQVLGDGAGRQAKLARKRPGRLRSLQAGEHAGPRASNQQGKPMFSGQGTRTCSPR